MVVELTKKRINITNLNFQFLSEIPKSVKIGIMGEFLGRIGMGLTGTYFIFYIIALTGSLVYYPIFLSSFLVCTICGSSLAGLLGSKYDGSKLLRISSIFGPVLIVGAYISTNSIIGMFILYNLFALIFSFFNPLFSSHIITETKNESRDLSYSFYRGASIVGQNLSGFIGGFILIVLFLNISNLQSLRFLLILAFVLLGLQTTILFFIHAGPKKLSEEFFNNEESDNKEIVNLKSNVNTHRPLYTKFSTYLILLAISLSSFGVGATYSYIALFITNIYLTPLGDISIILGFIGLSTGITTFTTAYFTKKIKRNKMLGFSDILFGFTSILIFFFPPLFLIYLMLFIREITSSITSPIANVILLSSISDKKRNLFSSIGMLMALVSELFGSVISVILIDNTGIFYNFLLAGLVFVISGSITFFLIKESKK